MTPTEPRTAYVVSHTHWDREWYMSYARFRVDLARVVGRVLDWLEADAERRFLLDGQIAVLEDHLRAHPQDAPRVEALARDGRLSLGPWFILPDEFLVCGESLARNLLFGDRLARARGGRMAVGYMPDSFGHVAQMPQILRRAGLDSFVFERGLGDEAETLGWRFAWRGPDGSEVLAINHVDGYCAAGGLGLSELWEAHTRRAVDPDRAVRRMRELFDRGGERPGGEPFLISNGCDHFPPPRDLECILAALRAAFPDTDFRPANMASFVDAAREAGPGDRVREGEMLGGYDRNILSGVWSTRTYLKQANERCETLLAGVAEPLLAYAALVHGRPYPAGLLDAAWRALLLNQPHDSICGCSIDRVHRDMEPRFAEARLTAERLLQRGLEDLAPCFGEDADDDRDTVLCLANPLPAPRREIVERTLVLPPPGDGPWRLVDESGAEVPCEVIETRRVERFWGVDDRRTLDGGTQTADFAPYRAHFPSRMSRPDDATADTRLTLRFAVDLPPCGHTLLRLEETAPGPPPAGLVRAEGNVLENDLVRVTLHPDGRFDVLDKRDGRDFPGLGAWEDQADAGDSYDARLVGRADTPRIIPGTVRAEATPLQGSLRCDMVLRLPARLRPDRRARVEETIDGLASLRLTLRHDSPLIEARLDLDHRAEDHRLRLRFPTPLQTDTLISEDRYLVQSRPLIRPETPDWIQPTPPTWPQLGFSCLEDGTGGLAVLNRGLPEVEGFREDGAGLALTLLRAVGWLSRDDIEPARRGNAGPTLPVPEAQCLGPQHFEFAVLPYAGHWLDADVTGVSERWRRPPLSVQGVAKPATPGAWLVRCADRRVRVEAIKLCDTRKTLVMRLCNLDAAPVHASLGFGRVPTGAWRTDLLENRETPLDGLDGSGLTVPLGPHEIATLEIGFDAQ